VVSSDGRHRRIVKWTWNGIENDVKHDQKNDPADSSTFSICAVRGDSSFSSLTSAVS
jgi:hypothetical protein